MGGSLLVFQWDIECTTIEHTRTLTLRQCRMFLRDVHHMCSKTSILGTLYLVAVESVLRHLLTAEQNSETWYMDLKAILATVINKGKFVFNSSRGLPLEPSTTMLMLSNILPFCAIGLTRTSQIAVRTQRGMLMTATQTAGSTMVVFCGVTYIPVRMM